MSTLMAPPDILTKALTQIGTDKGAIALPYAREVLLLQCHVAGTRYGEAEWVEEELDAGAELTLRREPDNPHDGMAILVLAPEGEKLGYIPRAKNEVLACLMDAGKLIFARLDSKTWVDDWLKLEIDVYLRDL